MKAAIGPGKFFGSVLRGVTSRLSSPQGAAINANQTWMPAFAGMTINNMDAGLRRHDNARVPTVDSQLTNHNSQLTTHNSHLAKPRHRSCEKFAARREMSRRLKRCRLTGVSHGSPRNNDQRSRLLRDRFID